MQDPLLSKDAKAWDKCYWLVYYAVQGFLRKIKEDIQEIKEEIQEIKVEKVVKKKSTKKVKPKIVNIQIPKCQSILF